MSSSSYHQNNQHNELQTPPSKKKSTTEEESPSCSSTDSSSRRKEPTRTNRRTTLPLESERALLQHLLSPHRFSKFSRICNKNTAIYGSSNTNFRRKILNRRNYLLDIKKNNFSEFLNICRTRGVTILPNEEADDIADNDLAEDDLADEDLADEDLSNHLLLLANKDTSSFLERATTSTLQPSSRTPPQERPIGTVMSRRSAALPALYPTEEEYTLNLEYPERNAAGMLVFRANDIEIKNELVDVIRIYKPLFDMRDILKTKAVLSPDGDYIKVTDR
jgi:hypothetical protein